MSISDKATRVAGLILLMVAGLFAILFGWSFIEDRVFPTPVSLRNVAAVGLHPVRTYRRVLISGTFCYDASSKTSFGHWGRLMAVDKYRRLAGECLRISEGFINSQSRTLLIHMAQAWLRLAHQAEKNLATNIDYEAPPPPGEASRLAVMQQQQIQPKIEE